MPTLVVDGREIPRADPFSMTFNEAKKIKNSLGVSVVRSLFANEVDEDALLAIVALSVMRADGSFDPDRLLALSLSDIVIVDDEPEAEEEQAAPLAGSSADGESEKPKPKRKAGSPSS